MQPPESQAITLEQVIACPKLPTLPAVAVEVLALTREPDVPIKKIAEVVQNDQAISAKILKTVNSSYYGLSTPCPSISRAMSYLGLNTVKSLVLGFSLVDNFKGIDEQADEDGFDLVGHWRRALYAASGARLLAMHTSAADPDECFIAALLHDVGSLAMFVALGRTYADIVRDHPPASKEVARAEHAALGFTRSDAGVGLAKSWRLPETLQATIEHRLKAENAPEPHKRLVKCVALGVLAAVGLGEQPDPAAIRDFKKLANTWLSIQDKDIEKLLKDMTAGAAELSKLFSLATGQRPNVQSILADAEDARMQHQISVDRQQTKLTEQAFTDGLTGIPNRKRFDELLEAAFAEAVATDGPVAVIFCDADKFKSVNDTHGHQAGDAVLVELGRRLTAAIGDAGTVCRYGGEELAMVLPNASSDVATQLGESIRAAVAAAPFDVRGTGAKSDELKVTISVGVAARDAGTGSLVKAGDVLLRAADKAVYAAKKAGRNCVRRIRFASSAPAKSAAAPAQPQASPAVQAPAPAPAPALAPAPAQRAPASGASELQRAQRRILIVEDDKLQATLLATPLRTAFPDATVDVAYSVTDANAMSTAKPYDLVFCDDNLGDHQAPEYIKHVRAIPAMKYVPVIVLSADASSGRAATTLAAGATAFVPKANLFDDPRARLTEIVNFWTRLALAA